MRNSWIALMLVTLACGAAQACGGSDGANDERPAQSGRTAGGAAPEVTLNGCVQTAPGSGVLVLQNVQVEPARGQSGTDRAGDRASGDTAASTSTITRGSWVRLSARSVSDMEQYVGQQVSVHGTIVDSGESTIGTSGAGGEPTPSGDRSRAADEAHHSERVADEAGPLGRDSLATGRAPEFQVQSVSPSGRGCADQLNRVR